MSGTNILSVVYDDTRPLSLYSCYTMDGVKDCPLYPSVSRLHSPSDHTRHDTLGSPRTVSSTVISTRNFSLVLGLLPFRHSTRLQLTYFRVTHYQTSNHVDLNPHSSVSSTSTFSFNPGLMTPDSLGPFCRSTHRIFLVTIIGGRLTSLLFGHRGVKKY